MKIDMNQLIRAALLVVALGIFILALTYVLPLLGILGALAIITISVYAIYLFLTGKIKF